MPQTYINNEKYIEFNLISMKLLSIFTDKGIIENNFGFTK